MPPVTIAHSVKAKHKQPKTLNARPPARVSSVADPVSTDEDDDDFNCSLENEKALEEHKQIRERDEAKFERQRKRECKAKGIEYVPPVKKKQHRKVKKETPALPFSVRQSRTPALARRASSNSPDRSGSEERPTAPVYDRHARARAIQERQGIRLEQTNEHHSSKKGKRKSSARIAHEDSSDEQGPAVRPSRARRPQDSDESGREDRTDDDEIVKHQKRLWADKQHPEHVTKARAAMEIKYNPLIKLLNIKLVIEDASDIASSDSDDNRVHNYATDSDDDDGGQRLGGDNGGQRLGGGGSTDGKRMPLSDSDQDVKPFIGGPQAADKAPVATRENTSALKRQHEPIASTSKIPMDVITLGGESEPEPDTEDDDDDSPKVGNVLGESAEAMEEAARVKTDPDDARDADDGDEDEEEEDPLTKLRRQHVEEERLAQSKAKEQAQVEAELRQLELIRKAGEERLRDEANTEDEMDVEPDTEEEEEELSMTQVAERAASQQKKQYPIPVKKGRPKFEILDERQDRTGPHPLLPGGTHQIPTPINKFLRPYQREGVEFLYGQYSQGIGGILGDDMGLGKTIQVIAFLSAVMDKTGYKQDDLDARKRRIRALPKVVHNWAREIQTWSYLDVAIYSGTPTQRRDELNSFRRGYKDVVIAGIETVRSGIDELSSEDFTMVIVDEAHRIKNHKSQTTIALQSFPTQLRYGLTGTAIQNRLKEFWCILNWAVPGAVGSIYQWEDFVSRPLKFMQKSNATDEELAAGRERALALVTLLLPHFWLRRTKHDPVVNLQLPRKVDNIVLCPLTDLQKRVYKNLLELEDVKIILTAYDPCPCGATDPDGMPYQRGKCCEPKWAQLIFKYMMLFQKVANHLALIYPDKEDRLHNKDKYLQDVEWVKAAFPSDFHRRKRTVDTAFDDELCGKWDILCQLLDVWKENGDKVLIFSMSLNILDLLQEKFAAKADYEYEVLDGSVPNDERMDRVDRFNDPNGGVFVFLLSTRAGGVGLNLTAANRVVIFDPNWNPSHDLQAMDRSYRFGQTRDVFVYRLIGAGTLEELIINRQQAKRALAGVGYEANAERRLYSGVEGEGKENAGELYGVKNIFKFSEHISLTEKAIKEWQVTEMDYLKSAQVDEAFDEDKPVDPLNDPYDLAKADAEELVRDLTGLGVAEQTPAQVRQAAKVKAEQARIAMILSGLTKIDSDKTLGSSKAEEARAKQAIRTRYLQAQGGPVAAAGKAASTSKDVNPALATQPWDPLTRGKKRKIKTEPETAPRKRSSSSAAPSKSAEPRPLPTHKSSPLPLPEDVEMDVKPDISRLRSAAAAPVSAPSTLAKVPNIKPEPSPGGVVPPLPPRARSPEPMPTIQDLERDFREMQADYGLDAPIEEVIARAGYDSREQLWDELLSMPNAQLRWEKMDDVGTTFTRKSVRSGDDYLGV